ncbi:permease [Negadavirga shengliensis]|uniref:Permease n=1 Tax=Negadavirga shengliensis TaxID=1389218 RepID=A0ABV9T6M0_9BACT
MMEILKDGLGALADNLVFEWLDWDRGLWYAEALHYFIMAFSQIGALLVAVVYFMQILTSYLSMDKIRSFLERNKKMGMGNVIAALLGAFTPFCSCSSIPLFVGMMQARVPLGIALSFLISSPLVNEVAIAIFWVSFGWKVTVIYVLTGILLGVVGGMVLDRLGFAKYVADWLQNLAYVEVNPDKNRATLSQRMPMIHAESIKTVRRLLPYVFIGLAVGSFIHGYVPASFFETYISRENPFAVPLAVVLAIPLYIDAVGILPVIESMVGKGLPLGTAIAFMMGSIGLSLPEALLLKKVMKKRLIVGFFVTIGIGMVLSGYLFNLLF